MEDKLIIGGREFNSRFILGSGKYSLDLIDSAVRYAGAEIITLALRRAVGGQVENILDYIPEGVTLLPNTSGARNAEEAVRIARLSRECGCGDFVKIEVIRDSKYLLYSNALYVPRPKCGQGPEKCRGSLHNATWLSNRIKQGLGYQRLYTNLDR